jgi:hypothetical protein
LFKKLGSEAGFFNEAKYVAAVQKPVLMALAAWCSGHPVSLMNRRPEFESRY